MLIDREKELAELNLLLEEPGVHLLALSGQRRLSKTTLLLEWAQRSDWPYLYWVTSVHGGSQDVITDGGNTVAAMRFSHLGLVA